MRLQDYHKEFIRGYVAAALWSSSDVILDEYNGIEVEVPLDEWHASGHSISLKTIKAMRSNCIVFLNYAVLMIDRCIEIDPNLTYSRAGHAFWLTHNHHGAGFWDGGWPLVYDKGLTNTAKAFKEMDLYIGDDGRIYH